MAEARLEGARQLRATMHRAQLELGDLEPTNKQAANTALRAARPPMRSGRLATTQRTDATKNAAILLAGNGRVPYAGPIHWGWPKRNIRPNSWLADAAEKTEPRLLAVYEAALEKIIDKIEGA